MQLKVSIHFSNASKSQYTVLKHIHLFISILDHGDGHDIISK